MVPAACSFSLLSESTSENMLSGHLQSPNHRWGETECRCHSHIHIEIFPKRETTGEIQAGSSQTVTQRRDHRAGVGMLYGIGIRIVTMGDIAGRERDVRELTHNLVARYTVGEFDCRSHAPGSIIGPREIACAYDAMGIIAGVGKIYPAVRIRIYVTEHRSGAVRLQSVDTV